MLLGHDKLDLVVDLIIVKNTIYCILFYFLFILFDEACLQTLNRAKKEVL